MSIDICLRCFCFEYMFLSHSNSLHAYRRCNKRLYNLCHFNVSDVFKVSTQFPHCHICNKTFCDNSRFNRHMKIHSGAKPFACQHCNYRCNRSDNLKKHIFTKHYNNLFLWFWIVHCQGSGVSVIFNVYHAMNIFMYPTQSVGAYSTCRSIAFILTCLAMMVGRGILYHW